VIEVGGTYAHRGGNEVYDPFFNSKNESLSSQNVRFLNDNSKFAGT